LNQIFNNNLLYITTLLLLHFSTITTDFQKNAEAIFVQPQFLTN